MTPLAHLDPAFSQTDSVLSTGGDHPTAEIVSPTVPPIAEHVTCVSIPLPLPNVVAADAASTLAPPVCRPPLNAGPNEIFDSQSEPGLLRRAFEGFPAWGVSTLIHVVFVLSLALWSLDSWKSGHDRSTLTLDMADATTSFDQGESLDDFAAASASANSSIVTFPADDVQYVERFEAELFPLEESPVAEVAPQPQDEYATMGKNALAGNSGSRRGKGRSPTHPDDADLLPAETSFYGVPGTGKRFCFVVDNSGSMQGARFQSALKELLIAVEKLNENQAFYIVFFSDGAYPMFFPGMEPDMIRATSQNKARVAAWIKYVELGPATRGSKAMQIAFRMRPDTIFMLGDGDFGDNTVVETINKKTPAIKIHTIGLEIPNNSQSERGFRAIAEAFYGTYRNVSLNE